MFTLVIGGSASGKSEYAERHVLSLGGPRFYVASMEPFGEEAQARIRRHHAMRRDRGFETIECYRHPEKIALQAEANVLLEDLGNLTANILFGEECGLESMVPQQIAERVEVLLEHCRHLTVVTNEVFSGGRDYEGDTDRYLYVLAHVSRILAARADRVVEVLCGIAHILKPVQTFPWTDPVHWKPDGCICESDLKASESAAIEENNREITDGGCAGVKTSGRETAGGWTAGGEMIFVTGPLFAGKQAYIMHALGWDDACFQEKGIRDVQDLAAEVSDPEKLCALADRLARREVVIATEVGGGVVPADPEARRAREAAGRLSCLLAERADTVIRVCCGLPQVLKGKWPAR